MHTLVVVGTLFGLFFGLVLGLCSVFQDLHSRIRFPAPFLDIFDNEGRPIVVGDEDAPRRETLPGDGARQASQQAGQDGQQSGQVSAR